MTEKTSPPKWFWIVSVVALIWNAIGVNEYLALVYMTPETLASLPKEEQALCQNIPAWAIGAFAIAVFAGTIGSLLLLLRKRLSKIVLILSLAAIVVQMVYNLFISKSIEVYGPGRAIMPVMVLLVGIGLVWLAKAGEEKGWLS